MIPTFNKLITDIEIQKAVKDNNLTYTLIERMNFDPCITDMTAVELQQMRDEGYEEAINA